MKIPHCTHLVVRTSVVAVQAALLALSATSAVRAAEALDPEVAELVQPKSSIEAGVGALSNGSFKANEYTGLSHKGAYPIVNFDVRSAGAYGSDDASMLRLRGSRLGTDAQSLGVDYSLQGKVRLQLGYDELQRNRSDSYRTPLLGAGTPVLTLPGNWSLPLVPALSATAPNARGLSPDVTASDVLVSGVLRTPSGAQSAIAAAVQGADLPAFQSVDLTTKRTRYELGVSATVDRNWQLGASFRHEDKVGLKPMGTVSRATGGDISTIIPDLVDQSTEQVNLDAQYRSGRLTLQGSYLASLFMNHVPSMTWSSWALPGNAQTMSTAPSNEFHQVGLTASFAFTPTTRLVANGSYARNTQNDTFLTAGYTPLVPVSTLNGLVVTKALNLKLNSRPTKDLALTAAYKLDDRDNRTPVNTYGFYDAGEPANATASVFQAYFPGVVLGSNTNLNANRPYSRKLNQLNLDADYQVVPGQAIKGGVDVQNIDRYCDGSWIACADAATTRENTLRFEWRGHAGDDVSARVAVAHASRKVDYNEDAWLALVPAAALSPTGAPAGSSLYSTMLALGLTGYGPISGLNPLPVAGTPAAFFFANNNAAANALYGNQNRISELPGMRRYNMADRDRNKLRLSLDWQATETFAVQAGLDANADDYTHSVYGLQKAKSYALNLDGTLTVGEHGSLNAFVSHEDQRSRSAGNTYTANSATANVSGATAISGGCFATIALRNASNKVDPCLNWTADMRDKVDTLGVAFVQKELLGGKLDLNAALSFSRARSSNDVAGGNYVNNPLLVTPPAAPAPNPNVGAIAAYYIAATPLPLVTTRTIELRLGGKYDLTKASALRVGYAYQHMTSSDWAYAGLQPGGLASVLPTYEQAPSYTVHSIALSYVYSFR
jgi:MtrB/PioB family decaheme-associated outer membrane protein